MSVKNNICLLSIDIGTTRAKAMLFNQKNGIIGQEQDSYPAYYPEPGFIEQDADEIFAVVLKIIRRLMDKVSVPPQNISAVIFDGIWHSILPVDKEGNALYRAINWADMRSIEQNEKLKTCLDLEEIKQRTGCTLHPMYFPSRLLWFKEKLPGIYKKANRFISIKEYIIYHLFGVYKVDHSIASGTGIWNMHDMNWDFDLLDEINIPHNLFSECVEPVSLISKGIKQKYSSLLGLIEGTPGIIGASDGAFSHLGSAGVNAKKMSLTVGTGAAMRRCIQSPRIIPGSEAWCYYLADGNWLLGGVMLNAGNVFQWFAENFMSEIKKKDKAFKRMDRLADEISAGAEELFFIPFLSGERCPRDRPDARGMIYGLTLAHSRAHIIRAAMEGLAYNVYSVYRMLVEKSKIDVVAGGGVFNSPVWLKILADLLGKTIWLPQIKEVANWGGILLGLRATGIISELKDSSEFIKLDKKQEPGPRNQKLYKDIIDGYEKLNKKIYGMENKS